MYEITQFEAFMKEQFEVVVEIKEVGGETVLLYHNELDMHLIPKETLIKLPDPVLFQTYIYNNESEWIVGVAIEAETYNPLFLVCLKDGVKVYEELLIDQKGVNEHD
ncbi:hypothetical protein ACWFRC_07535 [Bacillus cereus]